MGYFTIEWRSAGYTGSPGYTKLKFAQPDGSLPSSAEVNAAAAASRAFLASTATSMPTGVSYSCQASAQVFTNAGVLAGEVAVTTIPNTINGSGAATFPGGVGAVVYWLTGGINGGHKVKGRTYLVPLATGAFSTDGTLVPALVTNLQNAANTYIGTTPMPAVNTRSLGQADRGNATYSVTSAVVKDRSAFLRTRRT